MVPRRRLDRAGEGQRALRDRGARPGRGRRGRPRRDHRDRRASPRSRSARRSPTPTTRARCRSSTSTSRRLSMTVGDQHVAAGRSGRGQGHGPAACGSGSTRRWSATSRSACSTPSAPTMWEVQGRGELQLAVLVEMMRREGFELTVGKPQVVTRTIDGKLHEPVERVAVDVPDDYLGVVTQLFALRKGRLVRDGEPRHRVGPYGLARAGPRADRVPDRVPDRDARHGPAPPRVRGVRALARRPAHAAHRVARRRPARR